MSKRTLFLLLCLAALPLAPLYAADKKLPATPESSALVSWESPTPQGQKRQGGSIISWERQQPQTPQPERPLPPLVLPKQPNFILSTSNNPLRQYDVEEEPNPTEVPVLSEISKDPSAR